LFRISKKKLFLGRNVSSGLTMIMAVVDYRLL
jgi:hypothetical protein